MKERYSEVGGGRLTRIGAPFSNRGLGEAHIGGRFDVKAKPSGDGSMEFARHHALVLRGCSTREEGMQFFLPDVVNPYFDDQERILQSSPTEQEALNGGASPLLAKRHFTAERAKSAVEGQ